MLEDPAANIIMICTGTGSAPFRGFTERRRRAMSNAPGKLMLFFGARRPEELPYFGPLQRVPPKLLTQHLCYSRVPGQERVYVQDGIRGQAEHVAALLRSDATFVNVLDGRVRLKRRAAFFETCEHRWWTLSTQMIKNEQFGHQ